MNKGSKLCTAIIVVSILLIAEAVSFASSDRKIYFIDFPGWDQGKILQCDLDGSNVEELVTGLHGVMGIDVDTAGEKIYWSEHIGYFHRCNFDGTGVEQLALGGIGFYDIAVDGAGGKIYGTQANVDDRIFRVNLDGTGLEMLATGISIPDGIDLDVASGKVYWSDRAEDEIWRANLDGSDAELLVKDTYSVSGIALDLMGGKIYWCAYGGGSGKIRRSNLDGSGVEMLNSGLGSPVGIDIDETGEKVYWTDTTNNGVYRTNLDGSGLEDLVTGLANPRYLVLGPVMDTNSRYGGGRGTSRAPYLIYTAEQMNEIGANPDDWGAHFKLMADIDLSDFNGTDFNIIGSGGEGAFTGTFDGNGHELFNFTYSSTGSYFIGLFGTVFGESAEVKNLGLRAPDVNGGTGSYVGTLVGVLDYGTVSKCYAAGGKVYGYELVGGLVGKNYMGTIENCYSTSEVTAERHYWGGLVGSNDNATVSHCYAAGRIQPTTSPQSIWIGGLIGHDDSDTVISSFWDVDSSGRESSYGGTGKTTTEMQTESTFTSAGWDFASPVWTICEGADYPRLWRATTKYGGGNGTAEYPYMIYTPCHLHDLGGDSNDWDKHIKLVMDIDLGRYTGTNFNIIGNYGNPFTGVFDGNGHTISNFTYSTTGTNPVGLFERVGGGEIKDLGLIDPNINAGTGNEIGALVGQVANGTIIRCSVLEGRIFGDEQVGGLVGHNSGDIVYCYSTGEVGGSDGDIGGLVGFHDNGNISHCHSTATVIGGWDEGIGGLVGSNNSSIVYSYSTGSVSGVIDVGGFVGYNYYDGTITDCYGTGSVSATSNAGGLVGGNSGSIERCYSVGSVEGAGRGGLISHNQRQVLNSFWDVNSSDCNISDGGEGLTTTEMYMESTFTGAGWDFINVWKICEGENYPKLRWEKYRGGTGTADEPYMICSAEEMQTIGANPEDWGGHFKLMADIDLGGYTGTSYNIIGRLIYRGPGMFTGTFDGNRHTIYNFTYKTTGEYYIGLFGAVGGPDSAVEIKNLRLVDPNLDVGTGGDAGALVGLWYRPGTVSGCQVIGGRIRGRGGIGAIIGTNMYGNVSRCYSSTDVTAITDEDGPAGGLVGINNFGSIRECATGGSVTSGGNTAGGLVGWNGSGDGIADCYSTASVTAQEFVGGLVGLNGTAIIANSYAVGSVSGTGTYVGGLVGGTSGPVTASFWDVNTSGQPGPWAGEGKTTEQMKDPNTFISAGWDFVGEVINGANDIWYCDEPNYPQLSWEVVLSPDIDMDEFWMYQSLPGQNNSDLTASVSVTDDPMGNSSYSYAWEIVLPGDVTLAPLTVDGGGAGDAYWTFAARGCDEPGGLSDSGEVFTVRVTVTGDDYGNTGQAEAEFGIALLGDVNNDGVVELMDRAIVNGFWRTGSAGPFSLRDCDLNCDGEVELMDRIIANAVWRGGLGQDSVSEPCPMR